nr:hypothetical protein [Tanacetum cinerariifolium]
MWLSESWYVLMWLNEESGYRWFIKMKIDESIKRYQFWVIGQRWCLKNKGAISDANKNLSVKGRNSRNTDVSVECLQEHMIRNWFRGLEIDIKAIIFSDLMHKLQNGKKNREANICYTRFLSLIFKKLLGEKYINDSLTFVKPHTISAASFKKPLASEVRLTLHMLKVAKLSKEPEPSLILSFGKVNDDDTANKSSFRTFVQPVTQPKAPTDLKPKKKKITPSSTPKSSYKSDSADQFHP